MKTTNDVFGEIVDVLMDFAQEIGQGDPDHQTVINAATAIQNSYTGYDKDGNFVGVES